MRMHHAGQPGSDHAGSTRADPGHGRHRAPYLRLLAMAVLSFVAMYLLMYAMVDRWANVHPNLNQLYMAALMTAPMLIIELLLMGSMYGDKRRNLIILAAAATVLAGAFVFIRQQTVIGDRAFLQSMIPHHSGAILMCRKAALKDAEIRQLCVDIEAGQEREVDWMRAKLEKM